MTERVARQFCAAFLAVLFIAAYGGPVRADLRFAPPQLDLGEVKAGQTFVHKVKVTNAGERPVNIVEIKGSCSCLRPTLEPATLAPGAEGVLTLHVNTLSSNPGTQLWRVVLRGQDAVDLVEESFHIQTTVLQEIVVTPAALTVIGNRPIRRTLTVTDRRLQTLRVTRVETSSPHLTAALTAPEAAANGPPAVAAVSVDILESFPPGRHEERVILYTDDPEYPVLYVDVSVTKRPRQRFVAAPAGVVFTGARTATPLTRFVTLRDQQNEPLAIERIEPGHPALTCVVTAHNAGTATLQVTLDAQRLGDIPLDAHVNVHLRGQPEPVKIPVRYEE
jgi:hypothetical protein